MEASSIWAWWGSAMKSCYVRVQSRGCMLYISAVEILSDLGRTTILLGLS